MTNLDLVRKDNAAILQKMHDAVKAEDTEAFGAAFGEFANALQEAILKDARELMGVHDAEVLAQRGVRQLTKKETEFYQAFINAAKSPNPQQAITNMDVVFPETVFDSIFDYLTENHPLLGEINFQNSGPMVKVLMSTSTGSAVWGDLCDAITGDVGGGFSATELVLQKLMARAEVCNAFLDLGPNWVDRWMRTILAEKLAVGLEAAIVDGDGDQKPVGMTRALTGAVDGVHQRKTAVTVDDLTPETLGGILNTVSQAPNSTRRAVPELLMVVGPADYYTKVFPATTVRRTDGGYNSDVFPYPVKVVVSGAVPANHAIFGLAREYFMAIGTGKGGKLEYDDSFKFFDDARAYRIKLYGNGRPKDDNAFVYADITNLEPTALQVEVVNADEISGA